MGSKSQVVVVGGGAAGLAAAISAARAGAQVTVLEAAKRVGQKILKTGNGRCNLTNANVSKSDYNNPNFVQPILKSIPAAAVLEFFGSLGLLTVEEGEGRMYPLSNAASSVLDVLRFECKRLGIELVCEHKVVDLQRCEEPCAGQDKPAGTETPSQSLLTAVCADGSTYQASSVIIATGGGTDLLAKARHSVSPFVSVLCPLKTDTQPLKGLSGVRAQAVVSAYESEGAYEPFIRMNGEVLFRDYGVSGIVIFDLSRFVETGNYLGFDFIPQQSKEEFLSWLHERYAALTASIKNSDLASFTCVDLLYGCFHPRVNNAIIRAAGYRPSDLVREDALPDIAAAAKDFRIKVTGRGDAKQAQVTRGGACVDEFDPATLESRLCPGLYAAGEVLDIDGRCGGYNLHWAWASGITAGKEAARGIN